MPSATCNTELRHPPGQHCVRPPNHEGTHSATLLPEDEELGRKDDTEKPRWDLVPWRAMKEVTDVLTFGAWKYAPNNWQYVENRKSRYTSAMFRHVVAWLLGERNDSETDLHHLAHAVCDLLFLLSEEVGFDESRPDPTDS